MHTKRGKEKPLLNKNKKAKSVDQHLFYYANAKQINTI